MPYSGVNGTAASQRDDGERNLNTMGKNAEEPEAYIVQRYIENPYLIGGKKFDIRTYALVSSFYPLVVYIHRNGFCRFSNEQFSMNPKDISNLCMIDPALISYKIFMRQMWQFKRQVRLTILKRDANGFCEILKTTFSQNIQ